VPVDELQAWADEQASLNVRGEHFFRLADLALPSANLCKLKAAIDATSANWCFVPLMKTRGYIELFASDSLLLT
jgi:hypothetical protein